MTKIKASVNHFLISVFIFSIFVFTLIYFWYPTPYFTASGGLQGLKIVGGVDIILGPLLTLIIFNHQKSKKELFLDLSLIGLLQVSALIWGMHNIYAQRPVAVVYWEKEFMTIPAAALTNQGVSLKKLNTFGDSLPVYIYAEKPKDVDGLEKMLSLMAEAAIPPHHQFVLYQALGKHYADLRIRQIDINKAISNDLELKTKLIAILEKSGLKMSDYDYFPLRSKYHNIILMFGHNGELKEYISIPLLSHQ